MRPCKGCKATTTTITTRSLIPNKLGLARNETQFESIEIKYLKYKKSMIIIVIIIVTMILIIMVMRIMRMQRV
jgi:uncharacterized membrane protein YvbJ